MNLLSKTRFLTLALLIASTSFSTTVASPAVPPADVWSYSFSPQSMSFSAVAGSVAPASQNLEVKYAGDCGGCPPSVNATVPWIVVGKPTWSGFNVNFRHIATDDWISSGDVYGEDQRLLARRNPDFLHYSGHLNSHSRSGDSCRRLDLLA